MKTIEAVIFDMDGLLFDTELVYYDSTQKIADEMGIPYSKDVYMKFLGVSDHEVQKGYHELYKGYGTPKVNEFIERTTQDIIEVFKSGVVPLKDGALDLLDYLDEKGTPKIIASSNVRPIIEFLLENKNIRHRFQDIVSFEDVKRAKPDPEIFQKALLKLGSKREQTLVLEDSFHGIDAAHEAGIPVIMVPDLLEPTKAIKEKTLTVLPNLKEVSLYLANR